jgi:anti-anti-sigma factor
MVVSQNRDAKVAAVEVELWPTRAPAFGATIKLCGEHDVATSADVREALASIHGHVLVDLSECSFIDSSAISAFVLESRKRTRQGERLELVVPATNTAVMRALQVTGLSEILIVHESTETN